MCFNSIEDMFSFIFYNWNDVIGIQSIEWFINCFQCVVNSSLQGVMIEMCVNWGIVVYDFLFQFGVIDGDRIVCFW